MYERMGFVLLVKYENVTGERISSFWEDEETAARMVSNLNEQKIGETSGLGKATYRYIHARVSELDDAEEFDTYVLARTPSDYLDHEPLI